VLSSPVVLTMKAEAALFGRAGFRPGGLVSACVSAHVRCGLGWRVSALGPLSEKCHVARGSVISGWGGCCCFPGAAEAMGVAMSLAALLCDKELLGNFLKLRYSVWF
jgi:hypothetical protein